MIEKKNTGYGDFYSLNQDEVVFWIDGGGFMLKVIGMSGDPIELSTSEAIELAEAILKLAKEND